MNEYGVRVITTPPLPLPQSQADDTHIHRRRSQKLGFASARIPTRRKHSYTVDAKNVACVYELWPSPKNGKKPKTANRIAYRRRHYSSTENRPRSLERQTEKAGLTT